MGAAKHRRCTGAPEKLSMSARDTIARLVPRAPSSGRTVPYQPGLDGIRAFAALSLLVYHVNPDVLPGGSTSVTVFFVLSGYLITTLILAQQHKGAWSLLSFWGNRARRLWPGLALLILGVATVVNFLRPAQDAMQWQLDSVWAATYLFNWWFIYESFTPAMMEYGPSPLVQAWTLSIEEQFYLLWPLLLSVPLLAAKRKLPLALCVTGVGAAGMIHLAATDALWQEMQWASLPRFMQLGFGGLLAIAFTRRKHEQAARSRNRYGPALLWGATAATITIMLTMPDATGWAQAGVLTLEAVASTALIAGIETSRNSSWIGPWAWRPIATLGVISYGLYLWQRPVIYVLEGLLPGIDPHTLTGFLTLAALSVSVTVAMAWISWTLVESPIRRIHLHSAKRQLIGIGGSGAALAGAAAVAWIVLGST